MPVGFTQVSAHPFFSPFCYLGHVIISIGKCLGWRSAFKVSLALQSMQNPSRDALEIVYCPTGFFSVVPPSKQERPTCGPPTSPQDCSSQIELQNSQIFALQFQAVGEKRVKGVLRVGKIGNKTGWYHAVSGQFHVALQNIAHPFKACRNIRCDVC